MKVNYFLIYIILYYKIYVIKKIFMFYNNNLNINFYLNFNIYIKIKIDFTIYINLKKNLKIN